MCAVRQGTAWYGGPTINVFAPAWTNYTQELTAEDFTYITAPVRGCD
jgi:hypothetical protein